MKKILFIAFALLSVVLYAQTPKVSTGRIDHIENFPSRWVEPRNIEVWLPDGYDAHEKYSVVYMHDGQMLFDSTITWNKKEWKTEEVVASLIATNKIGTCIIVGIWNKGSDRIREYFPDKIFNQLDTAFQRKITSKYCNGKPVIGDSYLKFLTSELKPYVDQHYATYPDREHTYVVGSSMGGLISIYAISEYPGIFGGAACLSTAWLSSIEPNYGMPLAVFSYLKENFPSPKGHKIYMDYGTGESDKNYELTQSFVDLIAKGKGFTDSNYLSKVYDKAVHDEIAWSRRLHVPFEYLMKPR
jgi:predicted alpha/beta superfamily hydrolase